MRKSLFILGLSALTARGAEVQNAPSTKVLKLDPIFPSETSYAVPADGVTTAGPSYNQLRDVEKDLNRDKATNALRRDNLRPGSAPYKYKIEADPHKKRTQIFQDLL